MSLTDEKTAIEQCQSGDCRLFGIIYDRYYRGIYNYIFYKTGHKETAEDLVSAVFTRVLEKIKSFDPVKGSFQSWLYRVAKNALIDHYRTRKPEINIEEISGLGAYADTIARTDARLKLKRVEAELSRLTHGQKEIVILRVWNELSYAEIAEITGKTPAACKMAFSRAVAELLKDPALTAIIIYLALS